MNGDGVISINFEHLDFWENQAGWEIELLDSNFNRIYSVVSNLNETAKVFPNIGLGAFTYYIIICECDNFNSGIYSIGVKYSNSECWEKEPCYEVNDTNSISDGENVWGSINNSDDVDYYIIDCDVTGDYRLSFEHRNIELEEGEWTYEILNSNYDSVLDKTLHVTQQDQNIPCEFNMLEGEQYYIKVEGENDNDYKLMLEQIN